MSRGFSRQGGKVLQAVVALIPIKVVDDPTTRDWPMPLCPDAPMLNRFLLLLRRSGRVAENLSEVRASCSRRQTLAVGVLVVHKELVCATAVVLSALSGAAE